MCEECEVAFSPGCNSERPSSGPPGGRWYSCPSCCFKAPIQAVVPSGCARIMSLDRESPGMTRPVSARNRSFQTTFPMKVSGHSFHACSAPAASKEPLTPSNSSHCFPKKAIDDPEPRDRLSVLPSTEALVAEMPSPGEPGSSLTHKQPLWTPGKQDKSLVMITVVISSVLTICRAPCVTSRHNPTTPHDRCNDSIHAVGL